MSTLIDDRNTIINKYKQNIRGIFRELLKMNKEARENGHTVVSDDLITMGRDFILGRDPLESMLEIAERGTPIIDKIRDKEADYFQKSWVSLVAKDTNPIVKQILNTKFDLLDKDGNPIHNKKSVDTIFEFIYSIYKVSLKMILDESGILEKQKRCNGTTFYVLRKQTHKLFDSETLSHLLTIHKVSGIP